MKYDDSLLIIKEDNLYRDNYLNEENSYKQFVTNVDYQYQWEADSLTDEFEIKWGKYNPRNTNSNDLTNFVIGMYEEYYRNYWSESNQLDVFYDSLWICSYIAKYGGYDKFLFDRYICLSLIYKHGDFDEFLLAPKFDKPNIEREIAFLDDYISKIIDT